MVTPKELLIPWTRPSLGDGWVPTISGKGYRPWDPNPGVVDVEDLIHGLAYTYRYGGQTDPGITVAEHSIMASQIVEALWPDNLKIIQAALLHDASAAFLHDLQKPLRWRVRIHLDDQELSWSESDRLVTANICKQFGILPEHLDSPEIRAVDVVCLSIERRDCKTLHHSPDWGIPTIPSALAHLRLHFGVPRDMKTAFRLRMGELGLF